MEATTTTASTTTPSTKMIDPELGEATPLLGSTANNNEKPLEEIEDWTRREKAVAGVSTVSFVSSVGGMMISPDPVVLTAGTIGAVLAPYVAIQQQKISLSILCETSNAVI